MSDYTVLIQPEYMGGWHWCIYDNPQCRGMDRMSDMSGSTLTFWGARRKAKQAIRRRVRLDRRRSSKFTIAAASEKEETA